MENQLEYFDALINTQKQTFNNLLNVQKELHAKWFESIGKAHTALTTMPGLPETPQTKEALNQYNNWFSSATSNAQSTTQEAIKVQENCFSSYEKQSAISREAFKSLINIANPAKATN